MKQAIKHLKLRLEIATFFFRHPGPCTTSAALGPPSHRIKFFTQNKIFNSSPIWDSFNLLYRTPF